MEDPRNPGEVAPLAIQILHFRNPLALEQTLKSLFHAWNIFWNLGRLFPLEIHILDNGSSPVEADAVKTFIEKESQLWGETLLKFHRSPINKGFAAGHNELLQRTKPQGFVLFLNSDVSVDENFFIELRPFILKSNLHSKKLFVPVILENEQTFLGGEIDFLRATGVMRGPENLMKDFVSGCALMVAVNDFKSCGAWNEKFFFYGEDVDLSYRLLVLGNWKISEMKKVIIHHAGKGSLGGLSPRAIFLHFRARRLIALETFKGPLKYLSFGVLCFEVFLKSLLYTLRGRFHFLSPMLKGAFE